MGVGMEFRGDHWGVSALEARGDGNSLENRELLDGLSSGAVVVGLLRSVFVRRMLGVFVMVLRFAIASGTASTGFCASFSKTTLRLIEPPPAFIAAFWVTRLSLNSSTRSVFLGPPVTFRADFPRRMLFFSSSGAT